MSCYTLDNLLMDSCGPRYIEPLIKAYHYLHRMPAGILQCFVLLESNNIVPVGGAVFSNGRIQYQGTYEFTGIVTWADPSQGHTGALYKACNFTFDGYSRVVSKYKDLFTKRTIYQRSYTGQEGVVALPSDAPKKRFIYYFDKKKRESTRTG